MKGRLIIAVIAVVIAVALYCKRYVWIPDVLLDRTRPVGELGLPTGERIQVLQYWNHGDFYNLDLRHIMADGRRYRCVIDPDCFRVSKCELTMDAAQSEVTVAWKGKVLARYRWLSRELVRANGVVVSCELNSTRQP